MHQVELDDAHTPHAAHLAGDSTHAARLQGRLGADQGQISASRDGANKLRRAHGWTSPRRRASLLVAGDALVARGAYARGALVAFVARGCSLVWTSCSWSSWP